MALPHGLRSVLRIGVPLLLIALLAGCMIPPEPETKEAQDVFTLYNVIFGMGVVVFVAVQGMIIYSVIRYRRRDDRLPKQLHGNNLVEIIWTAIPTVIVLALFVVGLVALQTVEARVPNPRTVIEVDGFQWQWAFRYGTNDSDPSNDYTVTGTPAQPAVMVVPVGEPVHLILKSSDVIHSFYVPHFLVKRDVVPFPEGEPNNTLEFTIINPGTYSGQCAEFCGTAHAAMTFEVQAMTRPDYDAWLKAAVAGETAEPSASPAPDAEIVKITADQLKFSTDRLEVPAGKPFVIELENKDTIQHNVAIYDDAGTELFKGEIFAGPKTVKYNVPALDAGEYNFLCDVHPTTMFGTVVAK
jgi:cytochrome c oxidase subunit II